MQSKGAMHGCLRTLKRYEDTLALADNDRDKTLFSLFDGIHRQTQANVSELLQYARTVHQLNKL